MVGMIHLLSLHVFEQEDMNKYNLTEQILKLKNQYPDQQGSFHQISLKGYAGRQMASALDEINLRRVLRVMLDPEEFLSDYGIRSISKRHEQDPYRFNHNYQEYVVQYLPAESDSGLFGGNSNWLGPIWMPVNFMIIRSLLAYFLFYGKDFTIEFPTGSGQLANLYEVSEDLASRLVSIFIRNEAGIRPVFGSQKTFQNGPHGKNLLFC